MKRTAVTFAVLIAGGCASAGLDSIKTSPTRESSPVVASSFASPIGSVPVVTQEKDRKDDWYNAQDFGENDHLGEDWKKNTGGNTDCGEPVFAAGDGIITIAKHAGNGWGNVIIVEHVLRDGSKVQTLYGHLNKILVKEGSVKKREKIGTVGNADGKYLCHLHFEIRDDSCLMWDRVFIGYSPVRKGWLDPSDFIEKRR